MIADIGSPLFWQIVMGIVGLAVGYRLPDIDLAPVLFIRHRSVWTHGPLLPWACWWAAGQWPEYSAAAVGLLAGMAIHLAADAFPRSWNGSALINGAPFRFSLSPVVSFVYVVISAGLAAAWCLHITGVRSWPNAMGIG